jgi:translocation and assembly module TamB
MEDDVVGKKLPDWTPAHGRLQLASAQMAALALPAAVGVAGGTVEAMLELKTGKQLDGVLRLTNAATRALGNSHRCGHYCVLVRLENQRATLEEFHGQIGGQPVLADGFVTLQNREWQDYQVHPRAQCSAGAQSESCCESDLIFTLRGGGDVPPVVRRGEFCTTGCICNTPRHWCGAVRSGLIASALLQCDERAAGRLELDLAASGDRFLRVRTPVFSGLLSANLKLKGPLRAPVHRGLEREFRPRPVSVWHAHFESGDTPASAETIRRAGPAAQRLGTQLSL